MSAFCNSIGHNAGTAGSTAIAAGYAIAGDFDAVAHAWRSFSYAPDKGPPDEASRLLAETGLAALDTYPDDADALAASPDGPFDATLPPPVLEDALAPVCRSLAMWVMIIAGGSLVAALA